MDNSQITREAINSALKGDWKAAIKQNLAIIKSSPHDVEALNRLARAYFQVGLKTKSSQIYQKVLRLDKFNSIATKNLTLVKTSKIERGIRSPLNQVTPMFLEEPGITKTLLLVRPSEPKILSRMHPGDSVKIAPRQHCIAITSSSGVNLGRLPDDLAARLQLFIKAGSTYTAWIKSVETNNLKIFIREANRGQKYKDTPPFPMTEKLTYAAFTPPELVHLEKPDVSATEEQDQRVLRNGEEEEQELASE